MRMPYKRKRPSSTGNQSDHPQVKRSHIPSPALQVVDTTMDENRNPSSGLQISDATMDEYQDALPILQAIEPALEPIEMVTAVILLIGAIIGIFSASLTVVTALVGAKTKPAKPSLDVGPPWTMWMSTGHNGARNPDDVPLIGAAGPLPEVQIL